MTIRQEESTPIGNYFHDNGILKIFGKLQKTVDNFEVETEDVNVYCDALIDLLKGLKSHVKKVEDDWSKHKTKQRVADLINIDI